MLDAAVRWLALGAWLLASLLVVWLAYRCHQVVPCPRCGLPGRYYVGWFRDLRPTVRTVGPVCCKRCQARFVFLA